MDLHITVRTLSATDTLGTRFAATLRRTDTGALLARTVRPRDYALTVDEQREALVAELLRPFSSIVQAKGRHQSGSDVVFDFAAHGVA